MGHCVSMEELAKTSELSEAEMLARIESLRQLGYDIQLHPHRGYCLESASDIVIADELSARLPNSLFSGKIQVFRETGSTNDVAQRYGHEGHPEGYTIISESQKQGRGRMGRVWDSQASKGLWFSVLLRPDWQPGMLPRLTILASVAMHRAIHDCAGIRSEIKWPNDLLYKGCKLVGILCEAHLEGAGLGYAIIGIGCNVNHQGADFPEELRKTATSLAQASGRPQRRADLMVCILKELEKAYGEDWASIREEWKANCLNIGKSISMSCHGRMISGQMIDIDNHGALIFRHSNGVLETIHSGEIIL